MVEQGTENSRVGGSIPSLGTILAGGPAMAGSAGRRYRPPDPLRWPDVKPASQHVFSAATPEFTQPSFRSLRAPATTDPTRLYRHRQ